MYHAVSVQQREREKQPRDELRADISGNIEEPRFKLSADLKRQTAARFAFRSVLRQKLAVNAERTFGQPAVSGKDGVTILPRIS